VKTALKIFGFTVLVAAFYSYVGQMVPQKVTYPPEETEIGADMSTEQLVEAGAQIVQGKGTCLACHTMSGETGGRFPDLANIGAIAGTRIEGMSDVEYLASSLYDPNGYIVEGFLPGMPQIDEPPIDLSDDEILAVIAYLQSLGGTPTVTLATELEWQSDEAASGGPVAAPPVNVAGASAGAIEEMTGRQLFETYACMTCHSIDEQMQMIGPSLHDVGRRLTRAEIYQSILEPDETVAEGFVPGVMAAQLNATNFYERVTSQQLKVLVDYLASREGGS